MNFASGAELLALCGQSGLAISGVMRKREALCAEISEAEAETRMAEAYAVMKQAAHRPLSERLSSMGGLIGGEAALLFGRRQERKTACGALMAKAVAYAMGVLEVNASMGLIVAAPTAGSSGVLPGAFLAVQEEYGLGDASMVAGLFNAGAVGYLFTRNATISGAEGGCQAEVGVASAMAASAVAEILGGTPEACLSAASIAVGNLLGLVCDPIAGLVEAPCQNRNAMGVANALVSAEIALSGIRSLIPFDEMAECMYRVGRSLPFELRESALGGCAATPTGRRLAKELYKPGSGA